MAYGKGAKVRVDGVDVLRGAAVLVVLGASLFPQAGNASSAPRPPEPAVSTIEAAVVAVTSAGLKSVPDFPRPIVPRPSAVIPPGIRTMRAPVRPTSQPFGPTAIAPVKPVVPVLQLGSRGAPVVQLQRRLLSLGFWLVAPNGIFDDSTEQAVYALQKAAGIQRDGVVGPKTEAALSRGVVLRPRPAPGYVIEVDLEHDLVMFVKDSKLEWALNTSTGGGYTYCVGGSCAVAVTPVGQFNIYAEVDGTVVDSLGELWRPKYFDGGFALHGDSYVPPFPVSHGCVRVSNEAIDWIWATGQAPIGTEVWVY
jgi:Putative peptidoglycan binding domain/L,D-transpeptidase catalytic domain